MPYKRNRAAKRSILFSAVGFLLILFTQNRLCYIENCSLCNSYPYHEPCIINLSSGDVIPLTVYDPHPHIPGALSENPSSGYCAIVHYPGFSGYQDTNARRIVGYISIEDADPCRKTFCHSCRKKLYQYAQVGFVIADLQKPESPVFFPFTNGRTFVLRCYEITITLDFLKHSYTV